MSRAVTDAMSIVTAQTLGLQKLRREAAIDSAPKGFLTDEVKRKLRLSSFTSKLLFDGQVASICKENTDENQQLLIRNAAVSIQGKPVSSSSTRKAKSKSGKKKSQAQETPKKDFTFPVPRPQRKVNLLGDLTPGVEVVAPPIEEPPPARNTEVHTPLPLPLPNIPV